MEEEKRSVKFDKPVNFSKRVLVGNWVEERCAYKKNKFDHKSIYSNEFVQKKFNNIDNSNFVWDQKLKAEGHGFFPANTSSDPCSFYDNYSTTYGLSYKYFPNWFPKPIYRNLRFRLGIFEPQEEYLNTYGNLSNYGLSDNKKQIWKCDVTDPRITATTCYEDSFPVPEKSDYTKVHWCRITPKKDNHPSTPKCNILTWECKDDICCPQRNK